MKRFKDLCPGDTVWKLFIRPGSGVIRLNKLVVKRATPISEDFYKLLIDLNNNDRIQMADDVIQESFIQIGTTKYSIYCDEATLLQRIEEEEDLVISQLLTTDEWSKYDFIEEMFAEVYETI